MSKLNLIQNAIRELDAGAYQKLMDVYLYKKLDLKNIVPLGSQTGTNKTTKDTPDSYSRIVTGKYILIAYGTVTESPYKKIEEDIFACMDKEKTGIDINDIEQIICCYTSTNISPGQCEQLHSHFGNTLLIGIDDLSLDLLTRYPSIAKDHLSIAVDTHQIFDVEDFISHASQNKYSTPLSKALLCREKEFEEVSNLLISNDVAILCGKSGVGKTRLAIEVAKKYSRELSYCVKIIKSNSEMIYEDLCATFVDDSNFFVIVDDADQLTQINHLLYMIVNRKHKMKILLTVRDYAKEHLLGLIKAILIPPIYTLSPIDNDGVKQILTNNWGITNSVFIKQIQQIAKGSIRLAVMAAKCAVTGSLDSIRNAFDIFDVYLSDIMNSMNAREVIVATLAALFDSFILTETAEPVKISASLGIDFNDFREICYELHKKEALSIYNDKAIKFEEQNLKDYLLYFTFFKERRLSPSNIITSSFPQYKEKIVYAFNTLIALFYTEKNVEFICYEIRRAWGEYKRKDRASLTTFIEVFHAAIPDESLLILKQEIDYLPEMHTDFNTFDFDKFRNHEVIHSKYLSILAGFKYSNHFDESIHLELYHMEHNTENPMDYYFLFGSQLGFGYESYRYNFSQERILLNELFQYYKDKRTIEAAFCLIFCISNCLKFKFTDSESNNEKSITLFQFGLPANKDIFGIRSLCFKALSEMFQNDDHKHLVIHLLIKNYEGYLLTEDDKEILIQDIIIFTSIFSDLFDIRNFDHCLVLNHLCEICCRYSLELPPFLTSFKTNNVFTLFLAIRGEFYVSYSDKQEAELHRKDKLEELAMGIPSGEYDLLFLELSKCTNEFRDSWEIASGIGLLFNVLALFPPKFTTVMDAYIKNGEPLTNGIIDQSITDSLISIFGFMDAISYINMHEVKNRRKWLGLLFSKIPDDMIAQINEDCFVENLSSQKDENSINVLPLTTVIKINEHYPDFSVRYLSMMNTIYDSHPWVIGTFFWTLLYLDDIQISKFVDSFSLSMSVLKKSYINTIKSSRYYDDHDGKLFLKIVEKDMGFIKDVIEYLLSDGYYHHENTCLSALWNQDNFMELIGFAMQTLQSCLHSSYNLNALGEFLLNPEPGKPEQHERQNIWITDYIQSHFKDKNAIRFLFEILINLPEDLRKKAILKFCELNPSFSAFESLPLLSSHSSWSGSEVPVLEQEISYLNNIKNELKGVSYIEHRVMLDRYVNGIQEHKERVLLQEYIENR